MSEQLLLGIDIGGTKTAVAAVSRAGAVVSLRSAPSGRGGAEVVEVAARLAREVAGSVGGLGRISAVGACMPGLVDPRSGVVRHAVNLDVESLDLAGALTRALGLRVQVDNDVKAAALGAHHLRQRAWGLDPEGRETPETPATDGSESGGAGTAPDPATGDTAYRRAPVDTLAYLNLGTGLASAVVRGGVLVRGIDGAAGEIGHLPVGGDVSCTCGQVGCLETVASGTALARLWPPSRGGRDPFAAAAAGDAMAAAAVDVLCDGVGLAIQLLVLAAGAEHVVIGGGLTGLGEPFVEGVRADLRRRARSAPMIAALDLESRFELVPASVPVAAIGAALLPGRLPGPVLLTDELVG
ncbi:ROK family protein [Humibacillus xanthopallidus]|uniref:ROK family protein n=1 Tax=Humibacillus xanthopallidus TaxID=412689 RepID=UPI00384A73B2